MNYWWWEMVWFVTNAGKCMWTKNMHIWWKHAVSFNKPYIWYLSVFCICKLVVFQLAYYDSIIRGKQGTTWCYCNFLSIFILFSVKYSSVIIYTGLNYQVLMSVLLITTKSYVDIHGVLWMFLSIKYSWMLYVLVYESVFTVSQRTVNIDIQTHETFSKYALSGWNGSVQLT